MSNAGLDRKYPVCIAGLGARTPLGLKAQASAAAVRGGIGAIREHPYFVDKLGEPISVTIDAVLSPNLEGVERLHALAQPAIAEALAPLGKSGGGNDPIPAFIGLPESRPGRPAMLESELAARLEKDFGLRPTMIPKGHAAGLMAFEQAWRAIQSGQATVCLAGGVDTYLEPETLEWLDEGRQLMSARNRSGFVPGEGAGFCLLAATSSARRRRMEVLAWMVAAATTIEEKRIKTDDVCIGEGLSQAIAQATSGLKLPEERIHGHYCDLNGERYRTEEFIFAALRVQSAFFNCLNNVTPADCWGDMGAASGSLFAALAIASGSRGYAEGPRALMWASSEGGQRSAVLLHLATHAIE